MKHLLTIILLFHFFPLAQKAQERDEYNAIKLFIDSANISRSNPGLKTYFQQRLYTRILQQINQTGVAEIGYSTFLVNPKFDVLSISKDEAGIAKLYLAECELSLSLIRREYGNEGGASYASFSRKLIGSGPSQEMAISDAINSISSNDQQLVDFLRRSKVRIDNYFKVNCDQVIKQAEQAYELSEYARSIALYFSIPSSAKCYEAARAKSVGVYVKYIEDKCETQLVHLKTVVALAQKDQSPSSEHYATALNIIQHLNPVSQKCFAEAKLLIEKIEKRFTDQQRRQWELESKKFTNSAEVQKEMFKAMGQINSTYRPSDKNVIIVK